MFIKHTNYGEGVFELRLTESAESIGLESPFFGNVDLHCKMDKSHHQIILDCNITSHALFECDRCGTEYEEELEKDFELLFLFEPREEFEEDDDVIFITPDEDRLELSDSVRDYSIISIPLKHLCKDDCKGLCPKCGTNLNFETCSCNENYTNPIWDKLNELKK
ncbi:MAG: DUF177 domain-containing protein [Ignavibacteria bacterium]|nr:MAG: DUF177 domain-containing protein [Ignavibacteria bacterium]